MKNSEQQSSGDWELQVWWRHGYPCPKKRTSRQSRVQKLAVLTGWDGWYTLRHLSQANHRQLWVYCNVCGRGRTALSSECLTLICDAAWTAVRKHAVPMHVLEEAELKTLRHTGPRLRSYSSVAIRSLEACQYTKPITNYTHIHGTHVPNTSVLRTLTSRHIDVKTELFLTTLL